MALDWDRAVDLKDFIPPVAIAASLGGERNPLAESTRSLSREERVERLRAALRARDADDDLASNLTRGARDGLAKVGDNETSRITVREVCALEAVYLTDGTYPSLPVIRGFVDEPYPHSWSHPLFNFQDNIRAVVAATGKVLAPVHRGYAGTALLVADNLALTNRHVAEAIARETDGGWTLRHPGATKIDFIAEEEGGDSALWDVRGVYWAGPVPIGDQPALGKLDAAMLHCKPAGPAPAGRDPPQPVPLAGTSGISLRGAVCAIGFAARPELWTGPGDPPPYYEVQQVIGELFADLFGVKRLAPGHVSYTPGMLTTGLDRVFAHTCSTLAGNSGSPILDLALDGRRVLGLHFAGVSRSANYAHDLAAIRAELPSVPELRWTLPS